MDWDDLKLFLAVCQEGSVSGAGKALGINHTTVGRRMTQLEEEIGTRLFDRTREGYSMTQTAEEMLGRVMSMEEQAHAIVREHHGRDKELSGRLVVTAPYNFANIVLMPSISEFRRRYPAIELEISTGLGLADLTAHEADLAIRVTRRPPEHLVGRKVLPLKMGVYGCRKYLASPEPKQLILSSTLKKRPVWAQEMFPHAPIALRIDSIVTQHEAVRQGLGVARLPCFEGDSDKSLRRLDVEAPSEWGVWVLHHADLRATARVRAAREFFYDVLESKRALIEGELSHWWER